ncbi:MAG: hypothetical protein QG656_1313, partial [Candidatus Hydrogenedentes bacterium]|nr:hypothetical protein [Candidatus Hydrogenedentota bacterium]
MANLHIAVYLLTLGVSAGLTGIFGQRLLESQGVVPAGFQSDILLAAGAAAAYACVQLLYMGLIRLLYPTKSNGPVTGEILSLLGALAFVPYLLGFPLDRAAALFGVSDIPSAVLKLEPLLYLGLFGGIHGFFKLVSFYASMYSLPGSRRSAAVWLVAAFFAGGLAYNAGVKWIDAARTGQPYVTGEVAGYRVGQQYAYATEIPEGALFQTPVSPSDGMSLTWRWANSPANYGEEAPLDTVYVTATVAGAIGKPYVGTLQLSAEQWTSFTLPADSLPASATSCTVTWTSEREPAWRAQIGLPPAAASHRSLLVSGPFPHEERRESSGPNIVLIAVEGLGAQHVSGLGYERSTTPALDKFAYAGVRFVNAYTPSPEAPAACMTMLTGLNPLRHGYLGTQSGPLPE